MVKSFFEKENYDAIRARLNSLTPENTRQWGKMDIAQMLTHLNIVLEQVVGKTPFKDESNFLSRTLIKWVVMRKVKKGSFGKNSPTAKSFIVTDARVFETEKQRLLENLTAFYDKGLTGELPPHPAFGTFTKEQWGTQQYLHLDHHLTQFSA